MEDGSGEGEGEGNEVPVREFLSNGRQQEMNWHIAQQ